MSISQNIYVGNNSRVVFVRFASPPKTLARTSSRNASNSCALPQKPHSQKSTIYKTKAARLVNRPRDHNNQSLLESFSSRTITVLIHFLKLSKYNDEWRGLSSNDCHEKKP